MSDQKTVVITGASSGFGRHTAEAFAQDGWRVFAGMRDLAGRNAGAASALRALGVTPIELDVTDQASVDGAAATVLGHGGSVDVLVNNAGTAFFGITEAFTPEAAAEQFGTNVFGVLRVNRAFLPGMRERKHGHVFYVSSVVGRYVLPFGGIYTASKWALEALAETSAYELSPFGIDVTIVEPGAFETNIGAAMRGADDAERVASYGEVAAMVEQVGSGLAEAGSKRDARDVATAILAVAKAPAGSRPLRVTVPDEDPVHTINATMEPIQRAVLERFGLGALLPKSSAVH
jgi:NAD(P)-dependent dehydrogenase (short-subunit alcohol dehydrogenase family)